MENSTYIFADDTKPIGQMILFSLKNYVNKTTKWSKENNLEFNIAKLEAICLDVKELDQCCFQLFADDTYFTCKSLANDLGIIITNKLNRNSRYSQRLSKAQKRNSLEEKRSLLYKYESKTKFMQKLNFINSYLRANFLVLKLVKLQKIRKVKRSSGLWKRNLLTIVTTFRASFTAIYCPLVFLDWNDVSMLNRIYNCDIALKFDDCWKAFKGHAVIGL